METVAERRNDTVDVLVKKKSFIIPEGKSASLV